MTTLQIQVNQTDGTFKFDLSYTDGDGKVWTGVVADGGTVEFTSNGQYTLEYSDGSTQTFTFDAVSVTGGPTVNGAVTCGDPSTPYDLSRIVFPTIPPRSSQAAAAYAWCQQYTASAALIGDLQLDKPTAQLQTQQASHSQQQSVIRIKDPKLGLSNTTTTTKVPVTNFPSCSCSPGSG